MRAGESLLVMMLLILTALSVLCATTCALAADRVVLGEVLAGAG
jgi:hypothetical protein